MAVSLVRLLLAASLCIVHVNGSYFITLPDLVWAGSDLNINVKILRATNPVIVRAMLLDNGNVNTSTIRIEDTRTFFEDIPGTLKLAMPANMDLGRQPSRRFPLYITSSGGLTFTNSTYVTIRARKNPIFIQMDQHVYQPGSTVNFRSIVVSPMLKAEAGTVDMTVHDPNGNRVIGWTRVLLQNGVATQSFVLSEQCLNGKWKVQVAMLDGLMEEKIFKVEAVEYHKFGVAVDTGDYWLDSSSIYGGTVTALYPDSGNYVQGRALVRIQFADYTGPRDQQPVMPLGVFDLIKGETQFQVSRSILLSHLNAGNPIGPGQALRIIVHVEEDTTKLVQMTDVDVKIFKDEFSLSFTSGTPANFKPGLHYRGAVKVMKVDGLPTDSPVNVTIQTAYAKVTAQSCWGNLPRRRVARHRARRQAEGMFISSRTGCIPKRIYERGADQVVAVSTGGVVPFSIPTERNDTQLTVEVFLTNDMTTRITQFVNQMRSPSMNFLQITLLTAQPQSGGQALFIVHATEDIPSVTFEVLARGQLVATRRERMLRGQARITLTLTAQMAPLARLIVYYVRPGTSEVVADALNFNVAGAFENKVNVTFIGSRGRPGRQVRLAVTADVASFVGMLAVDRSANTHADADNDVTEDEVDTKLQEYVTGASEWPSDYVKWLSWPVTGGDAQGVFEKSQVQVVTDAWVYSHGGPRVPEPAVPTSDTPKPVKATEKRAPGLKKIRESTWIWTNSTVGPNGQAVIEAQLPDSLTTWEATAFSMHSRSGLGVAAVSTRFQSHRDFYIDMAVPSIVKTGEHIVVQVTVHNNLATQIYVHVVLAGGPSFKNLKRAANNSIIETNGNAGSRILVQASEHSHITPNGKVMVSGKGHSLVQFPISPVRHGKMNLVVSAQTMLSQDTVTKEIDVQADGIKQSYTSNILIDLTAPSADPASFGGPPPPGGRNAGRNSLPSTFLQTVELSLPPNTIPGSARIDLSLIGDLTGSALSLESLIQLPFGSGEQALANLATVVSVTRYLGQKNLLSPALHRRALRLMNQGYQRQMKYQRIDGSFTAFGDKDIRGSVWLTAYVLKVFSQAQLFITVDSRVVVRALEYILNQQQANGAFLSDSQVFRHYIAPGPYGREVATSAYVLATLLIYRPTTVGTFQRRVDNAVTRVLTYLDNKLIEVPETDPYTLSLMAYAYELAGRNNPNPPFNKLINAAVVQIGGDTMFWYQADGSAPSRGPAGNPASLGGAGAGGGPFLGGLPPAGAGLPPLGLTGGFPGLPAMGFPVGGTTGGIGGQQEFRPLYRQARAVDVEIAAYALQVYALRTDAVQATRIVKWLNNQRNPNGGFVSTQDTVVGLKALCDFAIAIPAPNALVTVTAGTQSYSVNISSANAQVLQTVRLPDTSVDTAVIMAGEGRGLIFGQVTVQYNVNSLPPAAGSAYALDVNILTYSPNFLLISVCARYTKSVDSGLAVMEIGIPSGFIADVSTITHRDLSRAKFKDGQVILFMKQMMQVNTCVQVASARGELITNNHAVPVTVYSYYEPSERHTVLYLPPILSSVGICDLCTQDCSGCSPATPYIF